MQNSKISEFKKVLYCTEQQEQINWDLLSELLPDIDPNSPELSNSPDTKPTLLFVLAEFVDSSNECKRFLSKFFADTRIVFTAKDSFFGNSILLWAISRYKSNTNAPKSGFGNLYTSNVSHLYEGIHSNSFFLDFLCKKIDESPDLKKLMTEPSDKVAINTPLLLAVKNYNLTLAKYLVAFYDIDTLMIKTLAGNSVLHLAAYFRYNELITAIIERAKTFGNDSLQRLLNQKNARGKTPADCYFAAPEEEKIVRFLRYADSLMLCGLRINDKTAIKELPIANLTNLVMDQAFVSLHACQEGAHRYTEFARGPLDATIGSHLTVAKLDLDYGDLSGIFICKTQVEPAKPKRVVTFFFSPRCAIKDVQKQEHVAEQLINAMPDAKGEVCVSQFYEGSVRYNDSANYPILTLHRLLPQNNSSIDGGYYITKQGDQCKLIKFAEASFDDKLRDECKAGNNFTKSGF